MVAARRALAWAAVVAALAAAALLLTRDATGVSRAAGSGNVTLATLRAAHNANDFTMTLTADSITTAASCYADPSVAASGSGSSVTFGASTATDTTKNFGANALAGKPITLSGQNIASGPSPATTSGNSSYTLTSVTDPSANYAVNSLAGLTVSAGPIFGSGGTVTYGSNTLTDTAKTFTTNQLAGLSVSAGAGTGTVASNTATTITLTANWSGGTPPPGTFYSMPSSSASGTIVSNTATTLNIDGVWNPSTPRNTSSFTVSVPAGKLSGSGGGVTYTRRDTGTGSSFTSTTLVDSTKAWATNEFAGAQVSAGSSTGTVASNTATTLTLTAAWNGGTPAASTSYTIFGSMLDTGLSLTVNQLAGLPIVAISPAISNSGGTVTYSSITGTGGTVTYGTNTLTDSTQTFSSGTLNGKTVVAGDVSGVVQSSSGHVITLTANWSPTQPVDGTTYVIATMSDTSKSFAANSLAGRTIISGSNTAVVYSNSPTTLVLKTAWVPATPALGDAYTITPHVDGGSIASNSANTLSLSTGWTPFAPAAGTVYYVSIASLSGTIASNTSTTMTLNAPWTPTLPMNGSAYSVVNSQPTSMCGVGSYQTTFTFDNTKLSYVSASNMGFLISTGRPLFVSPCTPTTTATTISFSCSTTGQLPLGPIGNGTIASVRFHPVSATVGDSTTVHETTTLVDIQGNAVAHIDADGVVLFSTCADMNGNGSVSINDVIQILGHIGETSSNPNWGPPTNDQKYDLTAPFNAITILDVIYALSEVGQFCAYP